MQRLRSVTRQTGFVALLAMAAILLAACTQADVRLLQGVLEQVDSVSGEVTVKLKDGSTVTVNLEDVDVDALKSSLGAASLDPGADVVLEVDRNETVRKIKTGRVKVEGTIVEIGPDATRLKIAAEDGGQVEVNLTDQTRLEADDDDQSVGALVPGLRVEVKYDPVTMNALKVEIEDEDDDRRGPQERSVRGTVTAIDLNAPSVTIRHGNGTERTYPVTPSTKIEFDEVRSLGQLPVGALVEAKVAVSDGSLTEIEAED